MMPEAGMFAPDDLLSLAQSIFPPHVVVELAYPWEGAFDLTPSELACLPGAVDKRLGEFAAGRRAARAAMLQLGHAPQPILHKTDRSPKWPQGLAGSISHTDEVCIAVLGHASDYVSLGLDIEEDRDLPEDVLREVCTPSELAWLSVMDADLRGRYATLIFSAKECAYKLQYPLSGQMLGFETFEITLDPQTGQFEATFTQDVGPFQEREHFSGRFAFGSNLVMTGLALAPKLPND